MQSRQEKQREASQRYQSSSKGSHLHAARQRLYRQRQKEKVTHQGSIELAPYDLLIVEPNRVTTNQKSAISTEISTFYCHFCGCRCSELLRWTFLHQQPRQSLPVHTF